MSFESPASTSVDELISLQGWANRLVRVSSRRPKSSQAGDSRSARLGRGLDFAEVRNYQPGDDVRMIDWKVTARTGNAHTKLFIEERERPFYIVVDYRAAMRFGTRVMYKSVLAARLASLLGWSAVANRDRVGGLVFTDNWHSQIRPRLGRQGLMEIFRAIDHAQKRVPDHEHEVELSRQFARLHHLINAGSSVCFLSDFEGFDEAAGSALGPLMAHCDVIVALLCDPLEKALPEQGLFAVTDQHRRAQIRAGHGDIRRRYARQFDQHMESVNDYFVRRRAHVLELETGDDLLESARVLLRAASIPSMR